MNACPLMIDLRGAVVREAAHGSQSGFEPAVVGFDPVVRVLLDVVPGAGSSSSSTRG